MLLEPIINLEFNVQVRQAILFVEEENRSGKVSLLGISEGSEEIKGSQVDVLEVGMQLGDIKVP